MDIGSIDRSATSGSGWLHRVSPTAKLVALGLGLAAVVITWNLFVAVGLLLAVAALTVSSRVDMRLALGLATYPALFALIFSAASAPDAVTGTTIVVKAVVAGLCAVTVVLTTPYPRIFAPIQRIVPGIVGDALLMTYRTTFLLLEKFSRLLRAIRLRSGIRGVHPVRMARATTSALGSLLLYALDLAQRDYDIMRLRGYAGRLRISLPASRTRGLDTALVTVAGIPLAISIAWRVGWQALNPYSWLVPLPALLLLTFAIALRARSKEATR